MLNLVPSLTSQLQTLAQRQDALETRVSVPTRAGALGLLMWWPLLPEQKSNLWRPWVWIWIFAQRTFKLWKRRSPGDVDLAKAVLAQSQALTALVGQIAQNSQGPLLDLGSSTSSASTRGAQGRARLQAELATHSGTFCLSVLRAMARRMQPIRPARGVLRSS